MRCQSSRVVSSNDFAPVLHQLEMSFYEIIKLLIFDRNESAKTRRWRVPFYFITRAIQEHCTGYSARKIRGEGGGTIREIDFIKRSNDWIDWAFGHRVLHENYFEIKLARGLNRKTVLRRLSPAKLRNDSYFLSQIGSEKCCRFLWS